MVYIHTVEHYSAIKKNEILPSNMDGPRKYYAKWNKSDKKDKYCMI